MKEVINIQETTREKKQYVRPQITMIPMQAEHALLAASPGGDINPSLTPIIVESCYYYTFSVLAMDSVSYKFLFF